MDQARFAIQMAYEKFGKVHTVMRKPFLAALVVNIYMTVPTVSIKREKCRSFVLYFNAFILTHYKVQISICQCVAFPLDSTYPKCFVFHYCSVDGCWQFSLRCFLKLLMDLFVDFIFANVHVSRPARFRTNRTSCNMPRMNSIWCLATSTRPRWQFHVLWNLDSLTTNAPWSMSSCQKTWFLFAAL